MTQDDLQHCIQSVQTQAPHGVDWEEVARTALSNRAIGPAWDAYWKHRSLASRLQHIFKVFAHEAGDKRAVDEVVEEVMFIAEIDNKKEALQLAKWLLQEEARFDEEGERRKAEYLAQKVRRLKN